VPACIYLAAKVEEVSVSDRALGCDARRVPGFLAAAAKLSMHCHGAVSCSCCSKECSAVHYSLKGASHCNHMHCTIKGTLMLVDASNWSGLSVQLVSHACMSPGRAGAMHEQAG
jgi:hypothetical protein